MYFQSCRSSWKLQFHEGLGTSKLPRWRWNRYRPVVPSEVPDKCLPTLRRRTEPPRPSDSAPPAPVRLRRNLRCCRRHPAIDRAVGGRFIPKPVTCSTARRCNGRDLSAGAGNLPPTQLRIALGTGLRHRQHHGLYPARCTGAGCRRQQAPLCLATGAAGVRPGLRCSSANRSDPQAVASTERLLARSTELCEQAPHVFAAIRQCAVPFMQTFG